MSETLRRGSGNHLVAVTHWAHPVEQELAPLAGLLGVAAYDLRLRITGPLPVVLANRLSGDGAEELLADLRKRGHGAVLCDEGLVVAAADMVTPRDFSLEPGTLTYMGEATEAGGILALADVEALILATQVEQTHSESQIKGKKFSAGRALATGGLVRNRKVKKEIRSEQDERELMLYVFNRTLPERMLLQESRLHYVGLGEYKGATRADNFRTLVRLLRQGAPEAFYDESLAQRLRPAQLAATSGVTRKSSTTHSNAGVNDLAAWLLVLGHMQGQDGPQTPQDLP